MLVVKPYDNIVIVMSTLLNKVKCVHLYVVFAFVFKDKCVREYVACFYILGFPSDQM